MDDRDRLLLDELQNDLPLVSRPFAALGDRIGMPEAEILDRIEALRGEGVVRQMSAIFDTRRLGYKSQLVAARSRDNTSDVTAAVFSSHPGVTHNYRREHHFDIWFTIAVPPNSVIGMDATVDLLGKMANVESIRPLPALKFFKIGVDLDMKGDRDPAAKKAKREPTAPAARPGGADRPRHRRDPGAADRPAGRLRADRGGRRAVRVHRRTSCSPPASGSSPPGRCAGSPRC